MDNSISTTEEGPDDLKITISAKGEPYTFYVKGSAIKSKSKAEITKILTDPITCAICCSQKASYALCMARCVEGDGKCCDAGATNCD